MNKTFFIKSALTENNIFNSTNEILSWIKERNNSIIVDVKQILFSQLNDWTLNQSKGLLSHTTGKYFTIEGLNVKTNWGIKSEWSQPIINQPEIGYLGIITKEFDGLLYFLLQAKVEPGNVNNVQLSPTLQATKSNYSQVHKGNKPTYLDYFLNVKNNQILLDQLQSEQGARFLKKRNRNIIIKIEEEIEVFEDFIWVTLGQIKKLITYDNLVNMDTRTVISGIPLDTSQFDINNTNILTSLNNLDYPMLFSSSSKANTVLDFDEILNWLTKLKCKYQLNLSFVSLFDIEDWIVTDEVFKNINNRFFEVIAADVSISNREVKKWSQPLIKPLQQGIIAFIVKDIDGVSHFLVQAKLECGNFDILEFAPTVQCITDSYHNSNDVPFLNYVLNASSDEIMTDTLQSEEGGRFYKEQNRNIIIKVPDNFPSEVPENYCWMTLNQLNIFIKFNNYLNIQARSLISTINFLKNENSV